MLAGLETQDDMMAAFDHFSSTNEWTTPSPMHPSMMQLLVAWLDCW